MVICEDFLAQGLWPAMPTYFYERPRFPDIVQQALFPAAPFPFPFGLTYAREQQFGAPAAQPSLALALEYQNWLLQQQQLVLSGLKMEPLEPMDAAVVNGLSLPDLLYDANYLDLQPYSWMVPGLDPFAPRAPRHPALDHGGFKPEHACLPQPLQDEDPYGSPEPPALAPEMAAFAGLGMDMDMDMDPLFAAPCQHGLPQWQLPDAGGFPGLADDALDLFAEEAALEDVPHPPDGAMMDIDMEMGNPVFMPDIHLHDRVVEVEEADKKNLVVADVMMADDGHDGLEKKPETVSPKQLKLRASPTPHSSVESLRRMYLDFDQDEASSSESEGSQAGEPYIKSSPLDHASPSSIYSEAAPNDCVAEPNQDMAVEPNQDMAVEPVPMDIVAKPASPQPAPDRHALPSSRRGRPRTRQSLRPSTAGRVAMPAPVPATPRPVDREDKDDFLVRHKRAGLTYKEIRRRGGFTEAESTLRGRYRTLTKCKEARVRKPEWSQKDLRLLEEAVHTLSRGADLRTAKVPWKRVAEHIHNNGGTYLFGNSTCRKRWDELVAQHAGRFNGSFPARG